MDSTSMNRAGKKSLIRRLPVLAGALSWFVIAFGCAVVEPPSTKTETQQVVPAQDKVIARLEAGRTGFVITETLNVPTPWRDDFNQAVALIQEEKVAEAIPLLEEIVHQSPGVTAPYINLARAYRHTEQFESAEATIRTALELLPDHPVANNEYGLLLRQTGRFKEARDVYQATLQLFPEYLPVRRNLGILCELYLNDTDCAVEQYTIYSDANPDDEIVALWIADLNLRDFKIAVPALTVMLAMPLTFSISDGLALGFVVYVLFQLGIGKGREVRPLAYVLALVFLAHLLFGG